MTIVWCSKRNQCTYLFTIGAHSQIDIPKRSSTHSFRNAVFLNKTTETRETSCKSCHDACATAAAMVVIFAYKATSNSYRNRGLHGIFCCQCLYSGSNGSTSREPNVRVFLSRAHTMGTLLLFGPAAANEGGRGGWLGGLRHGDPAAVAKVLPLVHSYRSYPSVRIDPSRPLSSSVGIVSCVRRGSIVEFDPIGGTVGERCHPIGAALRRTSSLAGRKDRRRAVRARTSCRFVWRSPPGFRDDGRRPSDRPEPDPTPSLVVVVVFVVCCGCGLL